MCVAEYAILALALINQNVSSIITRIQRYRVRYVFYWLFLYLLPHEKNMNKNAEVARILLKIAFLLEMEEEEDSKSSKKRDSDNTTSSSSLEGNDNAKNKKSNVSFKVRSYKRAADVIAALSSNIDEIYSKAGINGLLQIPSVGKAIGSKIQEYVTTGKIKYLEELESKTAIKVEEFYGLEGIGPRTIKSIYDNLGIRDISALERAASEGRLRGIPGFSQKKEELILKKIQLFRRSRGRYLIGEVFPLVKGIEAGLLKINGVKKAIAAGSFRRMRETIGDIDYVVVSDNAENVMDYFVSMPQVEEVLSRGQSKAFVRLNNGMDADLLVVSEESFGSALQYFTGSKEHGVALRKLALAKHLHLNEWGIFDIYNNKIAGQSEEEIYGTLGMEWIPPEIRENTGEIELAIKPKNELPKLVQYDDLRGDLQVHSNSTDGTMSIEDMAIAAKQKFGLEYIAITDHTKSLKLTHGLDEKQLLDQANKISEINDQLREDRISTISKIEEEKKQHLRRQRRQRNKEYDDAKLVNLKNFKVLSAAEVNILKDGSLDIPNNILDKLDLVGAAIHSNFSQPIEVQMQRLVSAARNPSVDIIFHPTGRLINKRDGYAVNVEKLIDVAKDTNTILEVDSYYDRLDLKDEYVRMAVQNDVRLAIDSDAHHPIHFEFLRFGIAQARRGWAESLDIVNTGNVEHLLSNLK
jgi:DNA polymerase (family X)